MGIRELQRSWNEFGRRNAMGAVLTSASDWQTEEFFQTGTHEIDAVLRDVSSLGISLRMGRALDFGCGVGRLSQALADHFDEVDGVDIAPSMIEEAQRLCQHPGRVRYHLNVRGDLRLFEDNTFDFVYSNITLQHMRPKYARGYIVEFLRVLRPGGVAAFQVPSELIETNPLRRMARRVLPEAGLIAYRRVRNSLQPGPGGADRRPVMEMYGIRRDDLLGLVERSGGRILKVAADRSATANDSWECFHYTVAKQENS